MAGIRKLLAGGGGVLANYNYTDIAAGVGYVTYYAGVVSGANILSPNTFPSGDIITSPGNITSSGYILELDKDFDVQFAKPQNIKGNVIVEVPVGTQTIGGATTTSTFINVKVRKWNGSTETELGQGSSLESNYAGGGADVYGYTMETAIVPITSLTHFKAGEYLRVTLNVYAKDASVPNHHLLIAHDPINRKSAPEESYVWGASDSSVFKCQIPFKMDI